jgi:hypothetical protein
MNLDDFPTEIRPRKGNNRRDVSSRQGGGNDPVDGGEKKL